MFVFAEGSGHDIIKDFHAGPDKEDVLDVSGYRFADFSSVMAMASQAGDDVVIHLDKFNSVTLVDTRLTALDEMDFVL